MKILLGILLGVSLTSCSVEPLEVETKEVKSIATETNTFTIKWESNQVSPYIIFKKYTFKDCKLTQTDVEYHREKEFNVQLKNGQIFEIDLRHDESVKNPELYLSIFKGAELQYEQETNSGGFLLQTFIDHNGNVKNT